MLKKLGIIFIVFTILRFLFYLFNYANFGNLSLSEVYKIIIGGFYFDILALLYFNSLFIFLHLFPLPIRRRTWYKIMLKSFFFFFNIIALIIALVDFEYFKFNNKRLTFDILKIVNEGEGTLFLYVKDFWYLLVLLIVIICAIEYFYRKTSKKEIYSKEKSWIQVIIFLAGMLIIYLSLPGSIGLCKISPVAAVNFAKVQKIPLVTNSPYTFINSLHQVNLEEKKNFKTEEINKYINLNKRYCTNKSGKHENVVIIILESFSTEFIGSLNNYKGYTPFIDSLISKSLVFPYAVSNAERSIKGIACILSSIPSLMDEPLISSQYQQNIITGLGVCLKQTGYHTSFFHGGTNGTMNFDTFVKTVGIDHYFGRTEFNNEKYFDGTWGIFDEEFFQFFAAKLNTFPKPFLSVIFSLSSHHPYTIPAKYKGKFPSGPGEIIESIGYTDYALQKFFETASKQSWYNNTLFVITADHPFKIDSHFLRNYKPTARKYCIPLIFYKPGEIKHEVNPNIVQQIDIMPSVLDHAGFPNSFIAFGNSVFSDTLRFAYQTRDQVYQIFDSNYILYFDGDKSLGLYNYINDTLENENILNKNHADKNRLENYIKAGIQQYNHLLISGSIF